MRFSKLITFYFCQKNRKTFSCTNSAVEESRAQKLHRDFLVAAAEVLCCRLGELEPGDVVEFKCLQHLLGLRIDLNDVLFKGGHVRDVVVATFTFLLLELDGDSTHLGVTEAFHQMSDEATTRNKLFFHLDIRAVQMNGSSPSNLVSQWLCRDDCDFLNNALVGVEVDGQSSVVFLDNDFGGLFDGFGANATLKN